MPEPSYAELERLFASPDEYPGLQRLPTAELRVWQFPSFFTWAGWSAHRKTRRKSEDEVWVRRITRGADAKQPELRGTWAAEARIEPRILDGLLEELGALRLPAWLGPSTLCLDGTCRGIAAGRSTERVTIEWWEHGPEALRELHEWHARAIPILDEPLTEWSACPWP